MPNPKSRDLTETTRALLLAKYPVGAWGIKACANRCGCKHRALARFREGSTHTLRGTLLQALYEDLSGEFLLKTA